VDDVVSQDQRSHYVDGISGATMTGKYLSEGLYDILQSYEPVSVKFRTQQTLQLQGVKR
jgi:Na+-transporting NADH:ubiquinone oxidoreductase subunit C